MMRAVTIARFGGPEEMRVEEVDVPEPGPTEVLVAVYGAGVNPVDAKVRSGLSVASMMGSFPIRLGWDCAGFVEAVGPGVTRFRPGDRVFGMPLFPRQFGAYADYVVAPSRHLARVPEDTDLLRASTVPLPATTAWELVCETAGAQRRRIVILGAGSTVGRYAVQIGVAEGLDVVAIDTDRRLARLAGLSGIELATVERGEITDLPEPGHVVIDLVGAAWSDSVLSLVTHGGLYIRVPSGAAEFVAHARAAGLRCTDFIVEPDGLVLDQVAKLIGHGLVVVPEPSVFDLTDVADAHMALEAGNVKGKMALRMHHSA